MQRLIRFAFAIVALYVLATLPAQAQVTFVVNSLPTYTPATDSIYIAGNFTTWSPGQPDFMLHKNMQGKWAITLPAKTEGTGIQYKFTRGSWETVEKGASGEEIANRIFTYGNGQTVQVNILNWADNGGGSNSTAAANVKIIDNKFYMPQFDRNRRIWVYFPPDYETSGRSYPVLYMHDGQNLFDATTSFAGEWAVDEALNSMASKGMRVPIVVGIDNGGTYRIAEYTPFLNPSYGGGDGEKYLQFIVNTLKPYIDQHYRTLPDRDNTGIMGSSLGGLISHFGALAYQDVFGKAGIFSPSYWFSDSVWMFTRNNPKQQEIRFYQLIGTGEGQDAADNVLRMSDSLARYGFPVTSIRNKIVQGGQHNEQFWRENFSEAYQWLFANYLISNSELQPVEEVKCFPNPVKDFLNLQMPGSKSIDTIIIYDTSGRMVKTRAKLHDNTLDVRKLRRGTYLLRCVCDGISSELRFVKQ